MTIALALFAVLAAWRLARMVVLETGPAAIFERMRFEIAKRVTPGGWIDEGMGCILCVSFWTALFVAILLGDFAHLLINWFGIAGGAAVLHLVTERD